MARSPRAMPRDMRHKLLRAEGALNRFLMVSNFLESEEDDTFEQTEEEISQLADSFVEYLCVQAPDPNSPLETKRPLGYPCHNCPGGGAVARALSHSL